MPAVIAMPIQPPIITRSVGVKIFEPAILALRIPVKSKPTKVNPTMLNATVPVDGAKAPTNGIRPPEVNERQMQWLLVRGAPLYVDVVQAHRADALRADRVRALQ